MVRINLLPEEVVTERKNRGLKLRFTRITVVIVVALIVLLGGLFSARLIMQSKAGDYAAKRAAVEKEMEAYDTFIQLQSDINSKSQLVSAAVGTQPEWEKLMAGFSKNIPSNVWLSSLTFAYDSRAEADHGQVNIRGVTYDHPSTANWLEKVGDMDGLTDVKCSFSTAEEASGKSIIVTFEINASLSPGKVYEPLAGRDN